MVNMKALCSEAPFRFGKKLSSSGIRTREPLIRYQERLPLGHAVAWDFRSTEGKNLCYSPSLLGLPCTGLVVSFA